jgi:integrase
MSKRANGEGSIYKRKDGRWTSRVSLSGAKRKDFYGRTRQEVAAKLVVALRANQDGLPIVDEKQTVTQFLDAWLESIESTVRPGTLSTYQILLKKHVNPFVGNVALSRLEPLHLQRLYRDRLDYGLSAQSVRKIHAVIHAALERAIKWGLLLRNVAHLTTPPRDERYEFRTLSQSEARSLLSAARGNRLEALYWLAITTGMRQGELLALRWRDVNFETGSLCIRGTLTLRNGRKAVSEPKTPGSRRQVAVGEQVKDVLRAHRARQAEERLAKGDAWIEKDYVFANQQGNPIEPTNLRRRSFYPLLEKAGIESIRFHDLRHTAATLLLGEAIHPKIVSERLGHSSVSITLDLYSHVTPTMQRQAAYAMDRLLGIGRPMAAS